MAKRNVEKADNEYRMYCLSTVIVEKEKIEIQDIPRPVIGTDEVEIKGCYGFVGEDFIRMINYMADGRLEADRMISQVIPLDDIWVRF